MTRIPMMLLLLLLSLLTPQILARATRSTSVTETIPTNEYTTTTGNLEWLTVTMPTDSDIILTTEDGLEMSTHLPDDSPTTEDSLRVKLQQEKDERHQLNPSTEAPKGISNLMGNNFTTEQTIESNTERVPTHALNKYNPAEDSVVEIEKLATYIKAATFLPDMTTHQSINNDATFSTENSAGETFKTTNWPPQEVESNSFRSNSFESISPSTDSPSLEGHTYLPNVGDSVESTTEINMEHFMTTFMTDPESKLVDTGLSSNSHSHIEDPLMNLLSMMSLNAFTEMAKLESEAELYSHEENKVELTTISVPSETTSAPPPKEQPNPQLTAEGTTQIMETVPETTIASPRELSFLESIILTPRAPETTTQSATTSTTTEEVPIPTSSSTTTEEIPISTSSSTTTEEIPLASSSSTTTEEIPLASSSSTTTEEIPFASSSSTTAKEIPISTSSSTTTEDTLIPTREEILLASSSSSTTEQIPIPSSSSTTTEEILLPSSSSTTTENLPLPTTSTTTESTPIPTTSSTTTESIPIPSTSSTTTKTVLMSTTSSTTTESIPITTTTTTESAPISTTTEVRLQATRAPRIERIFNSDGVEVLYGYSSVVRTNRL